MPLVIVVFGVQNAGKTQTWRRLVPGVSRFFTSTAHFAAVDEDQGVMVHVINSSAEEDPRNIFRLIPADAEIVCCSVQNHRNGWNTLGRFLELGYDMYVQWITPPYAGREIGDAYGIVAELDAHGIEYDQRDGMVDSTARVNEIRHRIGVWAGQHELLVARATDRLN
jgi:hypothetical protein